MTYPSANPLILRLAGKGAEPSIQLWVAAGLALGAGGILPLLYFRVDDELAVAIVLLSILLHLLTPLLAGVVAMMVTTHDMRHGDYDLMRLSLLAEDRIVAGYFVAALYRLRHLLGLLAVSGMVMLALMQFLALFSLPFVLSAWGFVRLAAAVGVNSALKDHPAWRAWTPPLLLFGGVSFVLAVLVLSVLTLGCAPYFAMFVPFVAAEIVKDETSRRLRPAA